MSKYIVEKGGNSPRILVLDEDEGTYSVLTHGVGENSLVQLLDLASEANLWHEDPR